ncbi:ABC transporter permease, partial [Paenibacillus riograndensis]
MNKMQLLNGIYDAALLLYALRLLFVFSDFLQRSPGWRRVGTGLLVVVRIFTPVGISVRLSQGRVCRMIMAWD